MLCELIEKKCLLNVIKENSFGTMKLVFPKLSSKRLFNPSDGDNIMHAFILPKV